MADGFVEVRFRPVDGRRGRLPDGQRYANGPEAGGRRRPRVRCVGDGDAAGLAHAARRGEGAEFVVRFDGEAATFTVRAETLKAPGRVGVRSKADSVTEFEDFR